MPEKQPDVELKAWINHAAAVMFLGTRPPSQKEFAAAGTKGLILEYHDVIKAFRVMDAAPSYKRLVLSGWRPSQRWEDFFLVTDDMMN